MSKPTNPDLSGISETYIAPLYWKAMESQRPDAMIKDEKAVELVTQNRLDFSRVKQIHMNELLNAMRIIFTREMDRYARDFISHHPDAVVVHIGCGLDTRFERVVERNSKVEWYDMDLPDVIELRRKFIGDEKERYHLLGCSVFEVAWLKTVKVHSQRPFMFIAETVFVYFTEAQVKSLVLTLRDHFSGAELVFDGWRPKRLIICFIAIGIGFFAAYGFKEELFKLLMRPLIAAMSPGEKLIFTGIAEAFFCDLKVAFLAGILLAVPVIMYELWLFIPPGLHTHERRFLAPVVILSSFFFMGGALFGYFVVFPYAFKYLMSFASDYVKPLPDMKEYLSLASMLLLAFGLIFELPLFLTMLARIGIVSVSFLKKNRKSRFSSELRGGRGRKRIDKNPDELLVVEYIIRLFHSGEVNHRASDMAVIVNAQGMSRRNGKPFRSRDIARIVNWWQKNRPDDCRAMLGGNGERITPSSVSVGA